MKGLYYLTLVSLLFAVLTGELPANHHITAFDKSFFRRLTVDDGLSQGTVNAIVQDEKGFLWFGTNDGLNRYDGYEFEILRHTPGDKNSISSNVINTLKIGPDGRLWIGTDRGLNSISLTDGKIKRQFEMYLPNDVNIMSLAFDLDTLLWITSSNHGLFSLNLATEEVIAYNKRAASPQYLPANDLNMVFVDSSNRIWVSDATGGLFHLDRQAGSFIRVERDISDHFHFANPYITNMREDENGILWFVSIGLGLESIDPATMHIERHPAAASPERNPYNFTDLYIKDKNTFWIADIFGSGLIRYNPETKTSITYPAGKGKGQLLMYDFRSVFVDRDENLWAGSHGRGINMLPADQRPFITLANSAEADIRLPFSSMRGIMTENNREVYVSGYNGFVKVDLLDGTVEDMLDGYWTIFTFARDVNDRNVFWLGTEGRGLYRMNVNERKAEQVYNVRWVEGNAQETNAIVGFMVYSLLQTKNDGVLYVGTDTGLNIYDPVNNTFKHFSHDPEDPASLPSGNIFAIYEDSHGDIWIGTSTGGMARFNKSEQNFTRFAPGDGPGAIRSNRVNVFYEDTNGHFWVGTNMGLHRMNRENGRFEVLLTADGLPNNVIYGILEDRDGRLWLSTNNGISAYNQVTGTFTNYTRLDGLPGNEFNTGSYFQANHDRLFFGGVEGLVAFDPSRMQPSQWQPVPVITKISYYGEQKSHTELFFDPRKITWDKNISMITIEYSSLNYSGFGKSRYAYSIDGNKIELGVQRQITLTRPTPGTYNLAIYATDGGGIWGAEPLTFIMEVKPFFRETLLFRFLIVITISMLVLAAFFLRLRAINIQKRKLESLVDEQTRELKISNKALKESNISKDMFFSIIAHDLKNPFNALLGFSELLEEQWDELQENKRKQYIKIIRNTSTITYQLLLNLLDWSLLERKEKIFKPALHKPKELIDQVLKQLSAQSEIKQISLKNKIDNDNLEAWGDPDMVSTIIRNLVSNAIKFSHKGTDVTIRVEQTNDCMVKICVIDKGLGLSADLQQTIFTRQNASSKTGTGNEKGTGLGLLLCAEFVKQHGGQIWVESTEGKGATFCFTLPAEAPNSTNP